MVAGDPLLFVTVTVVFDVPPGETEINAVLSLIENPAACAALKLTVVKKEQVSIARRRSV